MKNLNEILIQYSSKDKYYFNMEKVSSKGLEYSNTMVLCKKKYILVN